MNPFKTWMQNATADEKKRLAVLADTTIGTLSQIAGSYRTNGVARVGASLASRIERATKKLERKGLKPVKRTQLSPTCASCEFAKNHK